MASADGVVLPKPAIPKTLGILNVIFAVLLILGGLCTGAMTLVAPAIQQFGQKAMEQVKVQQEQEKATELKNLDDRAAAATTDEDKATIAKEREAVANRPAAPMINMTQGTEILGDPKVRAYTAASVITGLILHILLLVAGIGLIRLTPWGRTLGVYWATLQIVQLVILGLVNIMLILPVTQAATEANMVELRKQLKGPNAPPNAEMTLQISETASKMGAASTVIYLVLGMTYPIICLILLQTAGARAACLRRPPTDFPTTGYPSTQV